MKIYEIVNKLKRVDHYFSLVRFFFPTVADIGFTAVGKSHRFCLHYIILSYGYTQAVKRLWLNFTSWKAGHIMGTRKVQRMSRAAMLSS